MKLPEKVRISIDVIAQLRASDGKPMRVEDLAQAVGTTKNYLHQIVSQLNKDKYLIVTRGPSGGVTYSGKQATLLILLRTFGHMKERINDKYPSSRVELEFRDRLNGILI
jgi:hypothetical protein